MDHSYRIANGNLADGPPSTIEFRNVNGNRNGSGYHPEPVMTDAAADADSRGRAHPDFLLH